MAVLHNNKPRLMWGVKIPGFKTPQWVPGPNPLDVDYWDKIKNHATIQKWVELKFITVDLNSNAADPLALPTVAELEDFTLTELKSALKDPDIPATWHTSLEEEIAKRKTDAAAEAQKKAPDVGTKSEPKKSRPGLTGKTIAEALPLIAAETDVDKLIEWADADSRKGIEDAVDERLAVLEPDDDE